MRCKVDHNLFAARISKLFLDLRCMSVCCHTVCFHILIDFTVQVRNLCPSSCSGCSGLGINDQRIHIDQSFFCQRISSQDGACCIASRIGDQSCAFDIFSVHFTQSVNCFFDKLRALVLNTVPFFVSLDIFDTEICAQVDDLNL